MDSEFNIVQFFELVRFELEKELSGEIGGSASGGSQSVDPHLIHSLKEKVSAEFEKAKKSFEEEMEALKRMLKVGDGLHSF